jgi:hypothetical protein
VIINDGAKFLRFRTWCFHFLAILHYTW